MPRLENVDVYSPSPYIAAPTRRIAFVEGRYAAPFNGFICDTDQGPDYAVWGLFGKNDPLWGVSVTIDHGDGVIGYYSNLDTNVSVKAGQEVAMGEIIGQIGNTADIECKLEPHLHFGVTVGGAWTDPMKFVES